VTHADFAGFVADGATGAESSGVSRAGRGDCVGASIRFTGREASVDWTYCRFYQTEPLLPHEPVFHGKWYEGQGY
jgi:hypothetical protein